MSKLIWPPEKTFKYEFRSKKELDMEIIALDNDIEKGKDKEDNDMVI